MGTVMCDHIEDTMTHRMTLEKKRIAALKVINEARTTKLSHHHNPRTNTNRGNRRLDRHHNQDRQDRREGQ